MHDRKHDLNAGEARARVQDHAAAPHDRRHGLDPDVSAAADGGHEGERKPSLSAKSLAARGDAPDGSEDGRAGDDDARTGEA